MLVKFKCWSRVEMHCSVLTGSARILCRIGRCVGRYCGRLACLRAWLARPSNTRLSRGRAAGRAAAVGSSVRGPRAHFAGAWAGANQGLTGFGGGRRYPLVVDAWDGFTEEGCSWGFVGSWHLVKGERETILKTFTLWRLHLKNCWTLMPVLYNDVQMDQ